MASLLMRIFRMGVEKKRVRHYENLKRDVDPHQMWETLGELGDGAFGKVYKVRDSNDDYDDDGNDIQFSVKYKITEHTCNIFLSGNLLQTILDLMLARKALNVLKLIIIIIKLGLY